MWEEPGGATLGQIPSSHLSGRGPQRGLLRADPRYRRGSSRFTASLSPDPELGDEGAVALDVGVPQVVEQSPLLADQEKEAAARVMVLGVRFQVLSELPDASGRQRDLDLGGTGVLVCAPVFRDQPAFDFVLYCQTRLASIRGARRSSFRRSIADSPGYRRARPPAKAPLVRTIDGSRVTHGRAPRCRPNVGRLRPAT